MKSSSQRQKREQIIQDVPLSIAAFDEDALASIGADSLDDLTLRTPNVNFEQQSDIKLSTPTIRGVFGSNSGGNEPALGVYVDEVYMGNSVAGAAASLRPGARGDSSRTAGYAVRPEHNRRSSQLHDQKDPHWRRPTATCRSGSAISIWCGHRPRSAGRWSTANWPVESPPFTTIAKASATTSFWEEK